MAITYKTVSTSELLKQLKDILTCQITYKRINNKPINIDHLTHGLEMIEELKTRIHCFPKLDELIDDE